MYVHSMCACLVPVVPVELELNLLGATTWMLLIEPESSARVSSLNHCVISLVLQIGFYEFILYAFILKITEQVS